jgi:cytoskeletal protein CcmA (bactofilin family)
LVRRLAVPEDGICCILCGAALYASERSLQVQCRSCGKYVHVQQIRIAGLHEVSRTVTAATIVVEGGGRVRGDLVARCVEIRGRVVGNVLATDEVMLSGTARVAGHILCRRLHIEHGALVEGTIERVAD